MYSATKNRPLPRWGLVNASLDQLTMDSSLEVQTSHMGLSVSALPFTPSTVRSLNGCGTVPTSTNILGAASTNAPHKSLSRAYSATLSRFSSTRLGVASGKSGSKSIVSMSKALSISGPKLRKRPKLPEFNPPHCEKKIFDDGLVVQMIGSVFPPVIKMEGYLHRMFSFPPTEGNTPLLDIEFSLDETSFGFNRSTTASTLHIQVRSPSVELQKSATPTPANGSLQTIYHSMDSVALLANRSNPTWNSNISPFLTPFETTSQVNVNPRPSPRLSASLMPQLSPIILSELAALDNQEPEETIDGLRTPVTPAFTSDADSEGVSPNLTPLDSPRNPPLQLQMDDHLASTDTGADFMYNRTGQDEDDQTILESDIGDATFPSILSSNQSRHSEKEHRWDTLYPSLSDIAALDALKDQSMVPARQQQSMSSSSVLAPLTQADFDATFEEVFRVGSSGRNSTQDEDQTTPKRGSSTNHQLTNRSLLVFMHDQGTSVKA